jgi:hypothetical protein
MPILNSGGARAPPAGPRSAAARQRAGAGRRRAARFRPSTRRPRRACSNSFRAMRRSATRAGTCGAGCGRRRGRCRCGSSPVAPKCAISRWVRSASSCPGTTRSFLAAAPLAAALAAGNRALVKMSEITPATAALFAELVGRYFADDEVSVVEGDVSVAREFSHCPSITCCSPARRRSAAQVMRAAADNLTPVTLELGGKSPAIIGPGCRQRPLRARGRTHPRRQVPERRADLHRARLRAAAGRPGAGVHRPRAQVVARCYPDIEKEPRLRDDRRSAPVRAPLAYLDEAQGGRGEDHRSRAGGGCRSPAAPPAAAGAARPRRHLRVMQEEIFGPLLPVLPYRDLEEAIRYVNSGRGRSRCITSTSEGATSSASSMRPSPAASRSMTRSCTSRRTTCPSVASARAAWVATTALPASRPSRSERRSFANRGCPPSASSSRLTGPVRPSDEDSAAMMSRREFIQAGVAGSLLLSFSGWLNAAGGRA